MKCFIKRKRAIYSAIAVMLGVCLLFSYSCAEPEPAPAPSPAPEPAPAPALQVSTIPGQPVYQIGELITTEFVFKNAGTDTFQIEAFPPEIVLSLSAEDGVVIRRFPEGIESVYIDPGEVSSFTITWDQRDESGENGIHFLNIQRNIASD